MVMPSDKDGLGVLVTGGTGFIGQSLVKQLVSDGMKVFVLTRNVAKAKRLLPEGVRCVEKLQALPSDAAAAGVVNLAGANLAAHRWNPAYKSKILSSRLRTTSDLIDWMESLPSKPACLINASAVGMYGDRADEVLTEQSTGGLGFGHRLCRDWEAEAEQAAQLGIRLCIIRLGVVFDSDGGAFQALVRPYHAKVAVTFGKGRNWLSWIHREDVIRAIKFLLTSDQKGVFNLCAPEPVTYAALAQKMRQHWGAYLKISVPEFIIRMLIGEFASQVLLTSQRVLPEKLMAQGFDFKYPQVDAALEALKKAEI